MVNLNEIKAFFYAARFFGCGPHLVTDNDILLTRLGLFYTTIWMLVFACCFCYGLNLIGHEFMINNERRKIMVLTGIRTLLAYVCFFVDGLLTLKWNESLRSALMQMRNFDLTVNYGLEYTSSLGLRFTCWLTVITVIMFWIAVGHLTYVCEQTNPIFNAITYVIANAAISMQLIKFAGLLLLLRQRFRYLRKLLQSKASIPAHPVASIETVTQQQQHRELKLEEFWRLHFILSKAADIVNSVYSIQLLLWIITMWINALSRIYAILEGVDEFLLDLRESLLVTACLANLLIITISCHFTAQEANSIRKQIFIPQTTVNRKRSLFEHNLEIAMYFNFSELKFSAAGGFILVDLPLLLSIAGAMTTYLVLLHNNS